MPVSHALSRLFVVRELEEEQCRSELESAVNERTQLQKALEFAVERIRKGGALIAQSAGSGELCDRIAGLEESRVAKLLSNVLCNRISAVESHVREHHENYLSSRLRRRQVETLIKEIEEKDIQKDARRNQQEMDEWFRARAYAASDGRRGPLNRHDCTSVRQPK